MASIFTYSDNTTDTFDGITITSSSYSNQKTLVSVSIGTNANVIDSNAFYQRTSLSSVTFEAGSQLTSIGSYAFRDSGLNSITIPASVNSIGNYAFYQTTSFSSVTFEAGSQLTSIGSYAFRESGLNSITIPASVNSIEKYGFHKATSLSSVTFEAGSQLTSIRTSTFKDTALTSIIIPASVNSIEDYAFNNTSALASVTFEAGSQLTSIGANAFQLTTLLTSITIPASVASIGIAAFFGATSLNSVTFEAGSQLASIGDSAFRQVTSLTSITIPASVTSIGKDAFQDSSGLSSVTFEENSQLTSIGNNAFKSSAFTSITIPATVNSIGTEAFLESGLSIVYIANGQEIDGTSITSPATGVIFYGRTVDIYPVGYEPEPQSGSSSASVVPICFPAGTPVMTNKGEVAIEKLNPDIHKIRGKKIVAITEAKPLFKYIIRIEKNALGKNVPNRRTEISKDHEVFYKGKMIRSEELVEKCEEVYRIKYNGETLYNVLMESHEKMMINNLICETLHPSNIMAKLCRGKYTESQKNKIISELNKALKNNELEECKRIYKSLK
jgi:hypothetical protein